MWSATAWGPTGVLGLLNLGARSPTRSSTRRRGPIGHGWAAPGAHLHVSPPTSLTPSTCAGIDGGAAHRLHVRPWAAGRAAGPTGPHSFTVTGLDDVRRAPTATPATRLWNRGHDPRRAVNRPSPPGRPAPTAAARARWCGANPSASRVAPATPVGVDLHAGRRHRWGPCRPPSRGDVATGSAVLTPTAALARREELHRHRQGVGPGPGSPTPLGNAMAADQGLAVHDAGPWRRRPRSTTLDRGGRPPGWRRPTPNAKLSASPSTLGRRPRQGELRNASNVSGLSGTVQSAKLRLSRHRRQPSTAPARLPDLQLVGSRAGTGSITWNNRPAATGAALDDKGQGGRLGLGGVRRDGGGDRQRHGELRSSRGPAKDAFAAAARGRSRRARRRSWWVTTR